MGDQTLIMRFDYLSDKECMAMVNAIHKILKENNVQTYQIKFGTSVNGGSDDVIAKIKSGRGLK